MYTYTTTSSSHPSYKKERSNNFSTSSYEYTTTSTSSPFVGTSYRYTTTSATSSSTDVKYHFSTTSDFLGYKNREKYYESSDDDSELESSDDRYGLETPNVSSSTPKIKECMICVETFNINQFQKITSNCTHPNDICKNCVSQHIETQLNTMGDVEGILCPFGNNCGFLIEYNDVRRTVNPELFERYDGLSLNQALRNMPDFRWCKNAGCGSGQIHSGGVRKPIMTCKACRQKSCYTHDIPWHDGVTCEEYNEAKQGEDAATQDLLDRETKKCPKCGVRITKNGGCNHMTCKVQNCKYEFCWLCLSDYDKIRKGGNHFHKSTCQLYAPIS